MTSDSSVLAPYVINLTPHEITIVTDAGESRIPPSGKVARVSQKPRISCGELKCDGDLGVTIPLLEPPQFGAVDWPEFDKTKYNCALVSLLVGQAHEREARHEFPHFTVLSPDTSPDNVVRNDDGTIYGVRAFNVHS